MIRAALAALIFIIIIYLIVFNEKKVESPPMVYTQISEADETYYLQLFGYAMDNIAPGTPYSWQATTASGSLVIGESFLSKSKAACRTFTETFTIGGKTNSYEGIACRRGAKEEGWCRLKPTDALTCALERRSLQLPGMAGSAVDAPSLPSSGGIGKVGTPVVDSPNMPGTPDASNVETPSGADVADTVTGTAGKAAGDAAGGFVNWFGKTFGR